MPPGDIRESRPPGAVTPLDPELIQVGDAVGQRAQRRGLLEGAVRPVGVARGPRTGVLMICMPAAVNTAPDAAVN